MTSPVHSLIVPANTSTGAQDFVVPGMGQARAIEIFATQAQAEGVTYPHVLMSCLRGKESVNAAHVLNWSTEDAQIATNTRRHHLMTGVGSSLPIVNHTGSTIASIVLAGGQSGAGPIPDGYRGNWTTAPPAGVLLHVRLYDQQCQVHLDRLEISTSSQRIECGFQPQMIRLNSVNLTSFNNNTFNVITSDGIATWNPTDGLQQVGVFWTAPYSQNPSDVRAAMEEGLIGGAYFERVDDLRFEVIIENVDSTGFSIRGINRDTATSNQSYAVFVVGGMANNLEARVHTVDLPSSTTQDVRYDVGLATEAAHIIGTQLPALDVANGERSALAGSFAYGTQDVDAATCGISYQYAAAPPAAKSIAGNKFFQMRNHVGDQLFDIDSATFDGQGVLIPASAINAVSPSTCKAILLHFGQRQSVEPPTTPPNFIYTVS